MRSQRFGLVVSAITVFIACGTPGLRSFGSDAAGGTSGNSGTTGHASGGSPSSGAASGGAASGGAAGDAGASGSGATAGDGEEGGSADGGGGDRSHDHGGNAGAAEGGAAGRAGSSGTNSAGGSAGNGGNGDPSTTGGGGSSGGGSSGSSGSSASAGASGAGACPGVDITTNPLHCGSCATACPAPPGGTATCVASRCGYKVPVSEVTTLAVAAANGPFLAFFKDGKLLAAQATAGASSASLIDTKEKTQQTLGHGGGRPTVYIPSTAAAAAGVSANGLSISHYSQFEARTDSGTLAWTNTIHGCCGSSAGYALDPTGPIGFLFSIHVLTELNAVNGTTIFFADAGISDGPGFYVGSAAVFVATYIGNLAAFSRSTGFPLKYSYNVPTTGPVADTQDHCLVASDESFVCAVPNLGKLIRMNLATGQPSWTINVTSGGFPVLTSTNLVVLGAQKNGNPTLDAYRLSDGGLAWSVPTSGAVVDVLVGSDGVLYVASAASTSVIGLDQATGNRLYEFAGVGLVSEMLLRNGVIYAVANSIVVGFSVPAVSYDKGSSWPVRHHDNQRTRAIVTPLNY